MSDMIGDNLEWFSGQMKVHASKLLVYRRPSAAASVTIAMTIGGPKHPLFSMLGMTPGLQDFSADNPENAVRSFIFACADLAFWNWTPVTPQDGDEVVETINEVNYLFTVMPPGDGKLAWDYVGQHRGPGSRFIVHTQLTWTW